MEHNVPQPSEQSTQPSLPFHAKSTLQVASPTKTLEHQDPGNPLTGTITDNSKHTVFACMLTPFAILQAYMLWQTIAYTYEIHLNDREPLFSRVIIWTLTTVSFCRYTYSICACVTMYLYVFYPRWLPCETTLRKRNWNAYCFVLGWSFAAICAPFISPFILERNFYIFLWYIQQSASRAKTRHLCEMGLQEYKEITRPVGFDRRKEIRDRGQLDIDREGRKEQDRLGCRKSTCWTMCRQYPVAG
jgi:hypothetical protein